LSKVKLFYAKHIFSTQLSHADPLILALELVAEVIDEEEASLATQ